MIKQRGFSMLELLVAVIIIGLLVTLAVPTYYRAVERSKCSQALSNLDIIRKAQLIYYSEIGCNSSSFVLLEAMVGTKFIVDNDNWAIDIIDGFPLYTLNRGFVLEAKRLGGPHKDKVILLDQEGSKDGSTYPYDNPGG